MEQARTLTKNGNAPLQQKKKVNWGKLFPYFVIIPPMIHFMIFYVYVNISSILLAFRYERADGSEIWTLMHFETFFESIINEIQHPVEGTFGFFAALKNTLYYFAAGVGKTLLTSVIAYFLYKKIYLTKVYKIVFFLPSMIPGLVYIMIFKNFITPDGPLDMVLVKLFDTNIPPLLTQTSTATAVIIFYTLWSGFGTTMLIFVGSMNRIPDSVIEAGILDGCKATTEFFKIVMPLIFDTVFTYILIGLGCIFMSSGPILYFTNGNFNTNTLSYWIFLRVRDGSTNYPSAVGLVFTVAALPLLIISRWLLNKIETPEF